MLKKIGVDGTISSRAEDILKAEKLILPGVGAFDTCAQKLQDSGLLETLQQKAIRDKTTVLGVCVGMQLLTEGSEECKLRGLGWIRGEIAKCKTEQLWPS